MYVYIYQMLIYSRTVSEWKKINFKIEKFKNFIDKLPT